MSNKCYDILNLISKLIAPITVFFAALVSIWGIPYGEQIVATLAAVDVLVGAIVVIAKAKYDKALKGGE